ncbi:hypothetical protein [Paenibacillus sp. DYY-L-2]|uniref:hypothetical protein n=1 Tax=Paenibacillus sp. DYY-L-2 TaxID=3447013 RepID=UPI003F4FE6D3
MNRKSFYFKDSSEINRDQRMAYTISKLGTFDWVRFNMYSEDDIYKTTPGFYFRFSNGGNLYNKLKECIKEYEGKLSWSMYMSRDTKHQNYIIEPSEVCVAKSTKEYYEYYDVRRILKERYGYICETAIEDIEPLCNHIETWFNLKDAKPKLPD